MSDDVIIRAENIGKRYVLNHQTRGAAGQYRKLSDTLVHAAKAPLRLFQKEKVESGKQKGTEDFWALKDINFEIKRGEVVGIIGRNGAGKSTLLKILSRITEPTTGRITLRGRVASLLEVGTGFHPELTGRENIFLNGAILGMTKAEIRTKFDEIVAFAEIEKFLDTPVKRYSSGMYVRLAFAVAAHLEPEILIVDEVLAVGDAQFQNKCLGKMQDVARGAGRTVLFVSHNMAAVTQLTQRCILLTEGQIAFNGSTMEAVERYMNQAVEDTRVFFDVENALRKFEGNQSACIKSLQLLRDMPILDANEDLAFRVHVLARNEIDGLRFSMTLHSIDGTPVGSSFAREVSGFAQGSERFFDLRLPSHNLAPGHYYCSLGIGKGDHRSGYVDYDVITDTLQFEVRPEEGDGGAIAHWAKGWGNVRLPNLRVTEASLSQPPSQEQHD